MPISTYSDYLLRLTKNIHSVQVSKTVPSVTAGYSFSTAWTANANAATIPTTATICDNTTVGALNRETLIGLSNYDWRLNSITSQNQTVGTNFFLIDRLSHNGGLSCTSTSTQTTNLPTAALTRYTNGNNVFIGFEMYGSIVGAVATTITCSYTNQNGTPGQTSKPVLFGPGRIVLASLQDGDTGVRSVESVTLAGNTTLASTSFGITLFRVLGMTQPFDYYQGFYGANSYNAIIGGCCHFEPILPGACLQVLSTGIGGYTIQGIFNFLEVS